MRLFLPLWQRVFVYSLVLILASGAMGIYLVHDNLLSKASSVVIAFTAEVRNAMADHSPEEADAFLARLNNQEARFWVEDSRGILLAGQRYADRAGKDWADYIYNDRQVGEVTLWQTEFKNPLFLAITPCTLRGRDATLYAAFMAFPVPPLETLLSPGIITVALITGLLAFWMARKVSRPLRRLQREVSEISGTLQLRNVTVAGTDEIAEVASAINRLVDGLRRHMTGMNHLVLNISHELRSPLTRMALSVEMIGDGLALLKEREEEADPQRRAVIELAERNFEALRQELEHMDTLIGGTLTSSKLDVQDPGDLTETVSLSRFCENAVKRYDATFRQAGIRFMHCIDEGLNATGDATLLMQVLSNLLDNAAKYASGPDPQVRLRLYSKKGWAILEVENTHAPLPREAIEHIFDAYYRYGQPTGTGVGLGLSIVQKIMLLHGGSVSAANTGTGVLFRLSLPLLASGAR